MPHDPSQIVAPPGILEGLDDQPINAGGMIPPGPAPGTVFPALDGSDPGENDPGQNLGEFPFGAPLDQLDLPPADVQSGVISPAEVQRQTEEQLPDPNAAVFEGAAAALPDGGSTSNRKRSAEERIRQLTARYRSTETERDSLAAEVAQLKQIIMNGNQNFSSLPAPRPSGSGEASPSDNPLAGLEHTQPNGGNAADIRQVIREAVAPIAQAVTSLQRGAQQKSDHEASWARAVADFPELSKLGSEARTIWDDLYRNHPLATLPDGPEQIAVMTRGVLAGARRDSQSSTQRKVAASVQIPTPTAVDVPIQTSQADQSRVDQAVANARLAYRKGDRSFETYRLLRLAGKARAAAAARR